MSRFHYLGIFLLSLVLSQMADVYLKFGNNGRFLPITAVAAHRGFVVVETPSSGSFKPYEGSYALLIGESNYTDESWYPLSQ